jgi:hypothetical protein
MLETLSLWIGGVLILLAVLLMAASTGRARSGFRRGGGAVIGNALMRGLAEGLAAFQAIEEPHRRYVLEQRKGGQIEQDEEGGPDKAGGPDDKARGERQP